MNRLSASRVALLTSMSQGINMVSKNETKQKDKCIINKKYDNNVYELMTRYRITKIPIVYIIIVYMGAMLFFNSQELNWGMGKLLGFSIIMSFLFTLLSDESFIDKMNTMSVGFLALGIVIFFLL